MDLDKIDPRGLDVAHHIAKLSFRFYTDKEALRLSVRRITSPDAFDELGRPIARGLYDPALGPTSYDDPPCLSCGLGYSACPGHFGHIELPISIPNPLLRNTLLHIVRASCWHCSRLRLPAPDLNLLLARLLFEDAAMPRCGFAVEAFRGLRKRYTPRDDNHDEIGHGGGGSARPEKEMVSGALVKNWRQFFRALPSPIAKHLQQVGTNDVELVERIMLDAARAAWKKAYEKGTLAQHRSQGWKHARNVILAYTTTRCPYCFQIPRAIRKGERGRMFRKEPHGEVVFSPTELDSHVEGLWMAHPEVFDMLFGLRGRGVTEGEEDPRHRRLFVRVVLVPPSRFRPTSVVGSMAYAAEHPQNLFFQRLLTEIGVVMVANEYGLVEEGSSSDEQSDDERPNVTRPTKARFAQAMSNMQEALLDLYDSSGAAKSAGGNLQMTGIRQQLEAKTGLFRQHMMGKRVNFSCRSVIGPDVFLDTNEIGIPESFAKLLTVPEPVIPANLAQMQRAVLNGPSVYPGAVAVEDWASNGEHRVVKFTERSSKRMLAAQAGLLIQNRVAETDRKRKPRSASHGGVDDAGVDSLQSQAGALPKRVHRHLRNGDLVLFNRQPTLHRVSIMAHRVRVLPGDRTIRFHYANCGSYNADFDGDEMNVHVPQDYLARAEAEELMSSDKHYIVPTSGAPIRGLIQDHIAAATLLSRRDNFLEEEEFLQLLYSATENLMNRPDRRDAKYDLPEPALWKPRKLWTGKQLISSVLVVVGNGRPGLNLESGTRTKAAVIGSEESHVLFRNGELLRGIIDKSSIGASMYGIVHAVQEAYGCQASDDFLSAMSRLCVHFMRTHGHTTGVDDLLLQARGEKGRSEILAESVARVGISVTNSVYAEMSKGDKERTGKATELSSARVLVEEMIRRDGKEAEDRLDTAMKSELSKVASAVMKKCVPASLKKNFPENGFALMTNTGAKGSAVNSAQISCLLGSTVLEGKRVPRMGGSGATLPCFAPYDASPIAGGFISGRFLTGISPQEFFFHAMSGREGLLDTSLKTANSGYLQRCLVKHLEGINLRYDYTVRDSDDSVLQFIYGDDGIDPSKSRWLNEKVGWQVANRESLKVQENLTETTGKIHRTVLSRPAKYTALEEASPGALSRLGAISENYDSAVKKAENGLNGSNIREFLEGRYRACAAEPGEAVGILAAQGVGEPSTQMTLNTFHHAGSSSAHVTLGIPRLRELLMSASKYPRTPSMTLPILCKDQKDGAERLSRLLQNVKFVDLLQKIEVHEVGVNLTPGSLDWAIRTIRVVLGLPNERLYSQQLGFGFGSLFDFVADHFLASFHKLLKKDIRRISLEAGESGNHGLKSYLLAAQVPTHSSSDRGPDRTGTTDIDETSNSERAMSDGDVSVDDGDVLRKEEKESGGNIAPHEGVDEISSDDDSDADDEKYDNLTYKQSEPQESLTNGEDQDGSATDSELKPKKSKRRSTKARMSSQTSRKSKVPEALGKVPDAEVNALIWGKLGYIPESLNECNGQDIEFKWGLPASLFGKLDVANLAREAAAELQVTHVDRISRSFIDSNPAGYAVITEGSNIPAILDVGDELIDFDRLESNDMFGILQMYGVEAMRSALIQEFVKVFEAYGIPVNIRHLRLIADYMTAHGGYRGFNRISMDTTPSPFQRITFETSMKFLTDSALHGTDDMMRNPSAVLATGQVYEGGTGGFQLLHGVKCL